MTSEHEPLLFDLPRNEAPPGGRPPSSRSGQLQLGDLPLDVRRPSNPKVVSIDSERRSAPSGAPRVAARGVEMAAATAPARGASVGVAPAAAVDGGIARRLGAALISGAVQIAGVGGTLVAAWRLLPGEARLEALLPAAALFALLWSLAFVVLPLAFFRRTVGMAFCGLAATSLDRGPLSFGQALRRWIGGLITVALCGLPALLAFGGRGGRSLSDRLSGSRSVLA